MESKGAISSTFPIKKVCFSQSEVKIKAKQEAFSTLISKASRTTIHHKKLENPLSFQKRAFSNESIIRSWIFSASNSIQTHTQIK